LGFACIGHVRHNSMPLTLLEEIINEIENHPNKTYTMILRENLSLHTSKENYTFTSIASLNKNMNEDINVMSE